MEDKAFKVFDLRLARKSTSVKIPQPHQSQALNKLNEWSKSYAGKEAGGILVLPTGAGKTFTAVRFLCSNLISEGYKVVWLAHTHHLLEQAAESFSDSVGKIAEPKENLNVRIVSGTKSHDDVHEIKPTDDVLVITLQTMANAYERKHPVLFNFLQSAHGKLCVVFDEAHHSPAPTYQKLLVALRTENAKCCCLDLQQRQHSTMLRKKDG
jgi:ATP-dependent helicase IRC3